MAVDILAQFSAKSVDRILELMDRISDILFGLIMALTLTLTLGVVAAETIQVRTMLLGALGCNLAWGIHRRQRVFHGSFQAPCSCRLCVRPLISVTRIA
jgi:hypothetical protein